jgi:hypothetical protein
MSENVMLWILGAMQGVTLLIVGWIKADIKDIWKRVNSHGHQIKCDGAGCEPVTMGVLLHENGGK